MVIPFRRVGRSLELSIRDSGKGIDLLSVSGGSGSNHYILKVVTKPFGEVVKYGNPWSE